jgi:hypothetical protein
LSPLEDEEDLLPELRCGRIVTLVKENNPADGCIRSGGITSPEKILYLWTKAKEYEK